MKRQSGDEAETDERTIDDAVDRVFRCCREMERGSTLLYRMILDICNQVMDDGRPFFPLEYRRGPWKTLVAKLKLRFLDELGISLFALPMKGYRLALVKEQQAILPVRETRRACNAQGRGVRHLVALPDDLLSDRDRLVRSKMVDALKAGQEELTRSLQTFEKLAQPTKSNRGG